ncbi:16S rRNA (guanine(966)-N(2))-methyltransferase RsmD [Halomonas sp. LR5S13]|uniref:16S rRNA (guanine(966)-N(2))-methyltransferase RsmD n=1 Tax=Halomonas rhizosphaerae TaxID=3043296 RepID=UPI0024A88387|nr:16S rRNA (guanine(966)-N(2))-methyltransferase RsmD [Halomonas rhizosphaerae]MDI5919587.1 16S rRNA (guanine(966)-N(2))-methyltransferase RsmD [Halomonas rhizosphaerae]
MTRRRPPSRKPRRPAAAQAKRPGRLRLIGGEYRRRQLPVLDHPGLRPTPDRVRETLFNWLAAVTPGARVLDLFAGTGALGLEALSRGARQAVFVEGDARVARQLADNLATLGAAERGCLITADALAFLADDPTPFSLVFLDPPFRQGLTGACCRALEAGWLTEEALIYVETESAHAPEVPASWQLHREVRAGDSTGRLYRRHPAGAGSPHGDAC